MSTKPHAVVTSVVVAADGRECTAGVDITIGSAQGHERGNMYGCYLKRYGKLFIVLGLATIFAPTGGVFVLIGAAMLAEAVVISVACHARYGIGHVTRGIAASRSRSGVTPTTNLRSRT